MSVLRHLKLPAQNLAPSVPGWREKTSSLCTAQLAPAPTPAAQKHPVCKLEKSATRQDGGASASTSGRNTSTSSYASYQKCTKPCHPSRRESLAGLLATLLLGAGAAQAAEEMLDEFEDELIFDKRAAVEEALSWLPGPGSTKRRTPDEVEDYLTKGPYQVRSLHRQEHTCHSCFPQCVDSGCLLRIKITYPGKKPSPNERYPLAIFSSGYLMSYEQYQSYADRLASWGYVVLTYNKAEGLTVPLDDMLCACFISDLIDWASTSNILKNTVDTQDVYLCGHSRGGKVSVLAAALDSRVAALCLIDPVDNTVYAPLAPGYPSAVAALQAGQDWATDFQPLTKATAVNVGGRAAPHLKVAVPTAVVGGAFAGDCAPKDANYRQFFNAAAAPSWEVVLKEAGHFQFVDDASVLQQAICGYGKIGDEGVHKVAQAVMIAWAECFIRGHDRRKGRDLETRVELSSASGVDDVWRREPLASVVESVVSRFQREYSLSSQLKL